MITRSRRTLIRRTLANLQFIDDRQSDDGPFEITQLVNSFLVILLQNWDDLESNWSHIEHAKLKWPTIQSSRPNQQPWQSIGKIRDAMAHGLFVFEEDDSKEICALHVWTCATPNHETVDWDARITVEAMRQMLECFAMAAQRGVLKPRTARHSGDSCC